MQSILVAFDGSRPSTAALEYAFRTFPDADFTVLYALDDRPDAGPAAVSELLDWLRSSERGATERRDVVAEASERYGVTATSEVVIGKLPKRVVERSETGAFDQVFVGNYSATDRRVRLFANVTERIVRRASLPVTAVGDPADGSFEAPPNDVLVPLDGSTQANRALDYACRMFPNANVTGLHVVDPLVAHLDELDTTGWTTGTVEEWEAAIAAHSEDVDSLARSLRDESTAILERATSRAADHGVELSTVAVEGWPVEAILEFVDDESIDHVCMGCHSGTGYERFVLGSATESVLRDSPVPVTTLRRRPDEDER